MGVAGQEKAREARTESEQANPSSLASPIQDFYTDSKILITGATGFIGKALVEKLLRSCYNVSTIYLLIRPKRGLDVETRYRQLLTSSIFDKIRNENPGLFKKLVTISGDVQEKNLGLSDCDLKVLQDEVNVVFHSAATVRFNEQLDDAVTMNTEGTIKVVKLCKEMKNLKAFIHVSTAFSNADKYEVLETVYPTPVDPDYVINCCKSYQGEALKAITKTFKGKHPNTYTMTKAMAEWIIEQDARDLPVAIVRPSIVTAAWKDPLPGWVDNVSGITGIMMEIGRGTIRSIICDESLIMDMIPVDIVVNTLIASAWNIFNKRQKSVPVYNCVSGTLNPVSWYAYGRMTEKHSLRCPSKYVQWYPGFSFRTNRFVHFFIELTQHFLPAILVDIVMRMKGMKPVMLKIAKKFKQACRNGEFFALHEWKFQCDNMILLNKEIQCQNDRELFDIDIRPMEWESYNKNYMLGIRKYVLKDSNETLPGAMKKLKRLYWASQIFKAAVFVFLLKVLYSIFTNICNMVGI